MPGRAEERAVEEATTGSAAICEGANDEPGTKGSGEASRLGTVEEGLTTAGSTSDADDSEQRTLMSQGSPLEAGRLRAGMDRNPVGSIVNVEETTHLKTRSHGTTDFKLAQASTCTLQSRSVNHTVTFFNCCT